MSDGVDLSHKFNCRTKDILVMLLRHIQPTEAKFAMRDYFAISTL